MGNAVGFAVKQLSTQVFNNCLPCDCANRKPSGLCRLDSLGMCGDYNHFTNQGWNSQRFLNSMPCHCPKAQVVPAPQCRLAPDGWCVEKPYFRQKGYSFSSAPFCQCGCQGGVCQAPWP